MPDSDPGKSEVREDRRRWYRLHISTICLLVAAATVLILLVVPGELMRAWRMNAGDWRFTYRTFEHGWPCVYLKRTVISNWTNESPQLGIPWRRQNAWTFRGDRHDFRPSSLVIDVLAATALLALATVGAEWRGRRRSHFWQYSIADMLALTCLIAAGLGWYQFNRQVYEREMKFVSFDNWPEFQKGLAQDYRGPLWLRKLGGQSSFPILYRVSGVTLGRGRFGDEDLKRRVEELLALSSLESLSIEGPGVTDAGLECLRKLPRLRVLVLSSPSITDAGLAHVERLGALRHLSLNNTSITGAGLKRLRELKQLETLSLVSTGIDDASLTHLSDLGNLRELNLCSTQLNGSGLLNLTNLKTLEFVFVTNTPIKTEHVEKFKRTLPQCHVLTPLP